MIKHEGNFPIFTVEITKFTVSGVDLVKLQEEILLTQERVSQDPTTPLFEDTIFKPAPFSESAKLLNQFEQVLSEGNLKIIEIWSQIHYPRESTNLHNHAGFGFTHAFVYYVSAPEGAGLLVFEFENGAKYTIKPKINDMYVFPAWVKHKVCKNMSNAIRISISGNLSPIQN